LEYRQQLYYTQVDPGCQKEDSLKTLVEPLILYLVLFLPGTLPNTPSPDFITFSANREFTRMFFYNIPAFALIWYLVLQKKSLREWGLGLPGRGDFFSLLFAFPGLVLIGLAISLISPLFTDAPSGPGIGAPENASGWLVLLFSCISTGYLEESFFRFYLLTIPGEPGVKPGRLVFVSTLLFALCHAYEGPWGVLNAVLAGTFLALIFLHHRSLHGIALAHGFYNAVVYALGV
jgi:membrane protease YdiL (CAAX protease family)